MNVKTLIAASAFAVLGNTAFAFETPDLATPSTLSRAEVVAELVRAQKASEIVPSSEVYYFVDSQLAAAQNPRLSRAQVQQELATTADARAVNEAYGTVTPGQSLRSRAEVMAEAVSASSSGE